MSRKRDHPVVLSAEDRQTLQALITCGHAPARELTHARILLKADKGEGVPEQALPGKAWTDVKIDDALEVSHSTVAPVRGRFVENLEATLIRRQPKNVKTEKLDGEQEPQLVALFCSESPRGREYWSIRLLADRFVPLECAEEQPTSRELILHTHKKVCVSPG